MPAESIDPLNDPPRCTCMDRDGRYWCLLHDPDWPDTTEELIEAMRDA